MYTCAQGRLVRVLAFPTCVIAVLPVTPLVERLVSCQVFASTPQARQPHLYQMRAMPCSLDAQEREREHTERTRHAALADVARMVSPVCCCLLCKVEAIQPEPLQVCQLHVMAFVRTPTTTRLSVMVRNVRAC